MSPKYVLKVFPGSSKHFFKMKLGNFKFSKKKGLKSTHWTKKLPYFRPYLRQGHQFWAKNISDSKTMDISLKVPQILKKGKKYIKSTITWKIEILRKKNVFAIFFQKSIKSYIRYLLPLKKGKVYFRYFFNFSKKSRLFGTIYPFFRNFTKILDQKNRFFFLSRALWPPQKRVKGVKRVLHVLFQKVHRLEVPHPKYRPPIINRGKVIQMGGFYTAPPPPPHDFGFPMVVKI